MKALTVRKFTGSGNHHGNMKQIFVLELESLHGEDLSSAQQINHSTFSLQVDLVLNFENFEHFYYLFGFELVPTTLIQKPVAGSRRCIPRFL